MRFLRGLTGPKNADDVDTHKHTRYARHARHTKSKRTLHHATLTQITRQIVAGRRSTH